jgi:acetylornithine deacetylase/succinyl-diaminopimelate desuccinylase family protein
MLPSPDAGRLRHDLAGLVAIDTQNPPGNELEAAAFVVHALSLSGFEHAFDSIAPGRSNVIMRLANGDGPVFAFCTHMDVVPAGDGWTGDPFRLRESDGRLHGRGACDAKGALAAMLEAMRMLAECRTAWRGCLLGVFVCDEEVGSAGARRFAAGEPKIDFTVIGEPTGNRVIIAHKGSLRPIVRVHGRAAHSGTPEAGHNAIFNAARLCGLIEAFHAKHLKGRSHPLVGSASLTVTRIHGGVADNIIPDQCELLLDRRLIPGEEEADAVGEIHRILDEARERFGVRAEIAGSKPTTGGAAATPPEAPIVAAALAATLRHGVPHHIPGGFQGACDLVHFRNIGASGVVLGPGSLEVAHKADEFVSAQELSEASAIYRDIALAMLR